MIRSTFQLAPGIGPYRERQLWDKGVTRWDELPPSPAVVLSKGVDGRLRSAVALATGALEAGDAGRLAAMLPARERWRLYGAFAEEAGFLDIETDGEAVTCIATLDREGPRLFVRGVNLEAFPEATARWQVIVTFNGLSFDVPVLRRAFPAWRPPLAHVDLRHLWARLGHRGGLKLLEHETGISRPDSVAGVDGWEAVRLWRRHVAGEAGALRRLAEYNLLDAVNLRTLAALGYNRLVERHRLPATPVQVSWRGDVLYDMTRLLQAL